jgi:hypothetical protein
VAPTVGGDRRRESTKEENLVLEKEFAEDWFLELRGKSRAGVLTRREPSFDDMADLFEAEYELITEGERSSKWVQGHKDRLRLHLRPFFKDMAITDISTPARPRVIACIAPNSLADFLQRGEMVNMCGRRSRRLEAPSIIRSAPCLSFCKRPTGTERSRPYRIYRPYR